MSSLGAVVALSLVLAAPAKGRVLRVCADPNNLPFSNERGEGFEDELARLLAKELSAKLETTWFPQRRGFLRQTLTAKRCDLVMGVPVGLERVATTRPYYRSGYVFVYGPKAPRVRSLDAPELRTLRIGVPLVGDDGASPPPVHALGLRHLADRLRGYTVTGDYRDESPPAALIRAVRDGEVDLAVAWGPLAGYYASKEGPRLELASLPPEEAPPGLPFTFEIALGVRREDEAFRKELDGVLVKRRKEIDAILARYGVPKL